MKISIITSVLNDAKYLPRCVESVACQTYPCEHVIVDGGSTDGSQDIARDAGLLVVEAPGSNISEAFNIGIQNGSGEVIAILNADDWLERDAVERSVHALQTHPEIGFTYGSVLLHFAHSTLIVHPRGTTEDLAAYATKQMLFYHISSFVRRSVFLVHGLFDPKFKVAMDYDFYARIAAKGVRGVYVEGIIAHALAGGISSNLTARLKDYYQILSHYHGKAAASFYVAKYGVNSLVYSMLISNRYLGQALKYKRYQQLTDQPRGNVQ